MGVGNLEEMIDDNHAIVSSSVGPEYYVNVMSFVNPDLLEVGASVLLHNKVQKLYLTYRFLDFSVLIRVGHVGRGSVG